MCFFPAGLLVDGIQSGERSQLERRLPAGGVSLLFVEMLVELPIVAARCLSSLRCLARERERERVTTADCGSQLPVDIKNAAWASICPTPTGCRFSHRPLLGGLWDVRIHRGRQEDPHLQSYRTTKQDEMHHQDQVRVEVTITITIQDKTRVEAGAPPGP